MSHMDDVRARITDPDVDAYAQYVMDVVTRRLKKTNVNAIALKIQKPAPTEKKIMWLKQLSYQFGEAVKGLTPCESGCSYCCHIPTMITPREAKELEVASGRQMAMPATMAEDMVAISGAEEKWMGVPCPFLKDGRCSVYNARPFACRIHYAPTRDNLLCQVVPGEHIVVPQFDVTRFALLNAMTYKNLDEFNFADIREYFPT